MSTYKFYMILARTPNNGIGYKGELPWSLKNELKYFQRMTRETKCKGKQNAVIMGRATWESMPEGFKPLAGRVNFVLSRKNYDPKGAIHCTSLEDAMDKLTSPPYCNSIDTAWIIGGAVVYEEALNKSFVERIYVTEILKDFPVDTFVKLDLSTFEEINDPRVPTGVQTENNTSYVFKVYEKKPTLKNADQ